MQQAIGTAARVHARWWLGAIVLPLLAAAGCSTARTPQIPPWTPGHELRVGMATIYPPIAFKQKGNLAGVEADFAQRMGQELGVKMTLVELGWDDLFPALNSGRVDVLMSGLSITEERSTIVSFTQPYLRVGQMALIRRADFGRLRDYKTMNEPTTRVGFQSNTTGEEYVREHLPHAVHKGYPSPEEGIPALRAGEIDFFIHDAPTIWRTVGGVEHKENELTGRYRPLTEEYLAWAVRKGDESLREKLNATLLHWQKTGRVDDVLDRWITVRKMSVP